MTDPGSAPGLRANAATRIAVVGGGIAGLVAALECAKVGLSVTVLESAPDVGGTIRRGEVGGVEIDLGPDGWATAGGHVRRLIDELGLSDRVSPVSREGAWVSGLPGGAAAPLPAEAVLGIPANAWDPAVRRIIGWNGVWRAYLDRLRPPLTIGQQHNLDTLVRGRMGDLVADRLVAPISVGRYALAPAEIDVEVAAPGLNTALTRTGSLGGGVSQLLADPAPGYETLEGGLGILVDALRERLGELGVTVSAGAAVERLARSRGGWLVQVSADSAPETLDVDAVVVATGEGEARRLLGDHVPSIPRREAETQTVVTLVVRSADLDGHPRGAVVYPLPGAGDIASVAHVTARWPWLQSLAAHTHVLRVTFVPGTHAPTAGTDDPEVVAAAVAAASRHLGLSIAGDAVLGARAEVFSPARPAAAVGLLAAAGAVRAAVREVDGLAVTGAWLSGSGLAQVIPDARAEAERVRRIALWGSANTTD